MRFVLGLLAGLVALVLVWLLGGQITGRSTVPASAAGTTLAIDFHVGDDTATGVGNVSTCLEVSSGAMYTLDVDVLNVTNVIAAQITLNYAGTVTARSIGVLNGTPPPRFLEPKSLLNNAPGSGANAANIDASASNALPDSSGGHTVVMSNDAAIGNGAGADGTGLLIRFTMTAPTVGSPTMVPITLTNTTLNDALANEIPHIDQGATLIVAPDATTNCPSPPLLAVDLATGDNTATGVGNVTDYLVASCDATYTVDVFVKSMTDLVGAQFSLSSAVGNVVTGRTVSGSIIDAGTGLSSTGTATIEEVGSDHFPMATAATSSSLRMTPPSAAVAHPGAASSCG